jgi:competence CoiA-like predicted nuclease
MLTTCFVDGVKVSIDDYKKQEGKDPLCPMSHKLVAKKGKKVVHHFAHHPNDKIYYYILLPILEF